jgi:hypothetical protein
VSDKSPPKRALEPPATKLAANVILPQPADGDVDNIAAQLRRRREAAKRMPPLPSGKRDPIDLETYLKPSRWGDDAS